LGKETQGQQIERHIKREHEESEYAPMDSNAEFTLSTGQGDSRRDFSFSSPHRHFTKEFLTAMSWLPELLARLVGESGEGLSEYLNVRSVAADGDVTTSDDVILANAAASKVTLALPSATTKGKLLIFIKTDAEANEVELDAFGNDLINGQATKTLSSQFDKVMLISDGISSWYVLA
jgi:hypothetical protein